MNKENNNTIINYKSYLKREREKFKDYLGSATRYLANKRMKNIKYHG